MGKNQHVLPKGGKWQVKGEGNSRATKTFDTQKAAEIYARQIAKNQESELITHGRDGKIRSKIPMAMILIHRKTKKISH